VNGITRRDALLALAATPLTTLSRSDDEFLDDLSKRCFRYFYDQADVTTYLALDRTTTDGSRSFWAANVANIAASGFGITALCIGAHRRWIPAALARRRILSTLRFLVEHTYNAAGWFWHFMDATSGAQQWGCEISSIDTALLLAGVLTARVYFADDHELVKLATQLYERVDFTWMLHDNPHLLCHGWRDGQFLKYRWDAYCELGILYLLAIGSPTHPIPASSWYAWARPVVKYDQFTFVSGGPLFTHQYTQAWVDMRGLHDSPPSNLNYFKNSITATQANRAFCMDLKAAYPKSYSDDIWGLTASDGMHGYYAWGDVPGKRDVDGTVVPCAAGGSLMFASDLCLRALRAMQDKFGKRIWGRYGFCDAFNPTADWIDDDIIGIDQGITLLSAENLRTGNVWKWFMRNPEITKAMHLAKFSAGG